ncbi:MAG: N-acetyltransferase [Sphingomicrobium sp.]
MIDHSPEQVAIRLEPGSTGDLDQVIAVMNSAFDDRFGEAWTRSQCAGILPMPGVVLMIARNGVDSAIGFSLSRIIAGEAELLLLAVAPDHRRRKVGTVLLDQFLERARENGANRVHLEVRDGNPAVKMYRAAGFYGAGRRRKYYHGRDGSEFDALTFSRTV